jgi:hypothetical protein
MKSPSLSSLKDVDDSSGPLVPTGATEFKPSKQISPELMQKLLELDKARKDANDNKAINGNVMPSILQPSNNTSQSLEGDGKVIVSSYQTLPASLVRGNLRSKSARTYQSSKYGSSGMIAQPKSQPSSPSLARKMILDKNQDVGNDDSTAQKNAENVFSRLTSNLGNDSDPDV